MKNKALKRVFVSLIVLMICMTMVMGSSCSYLIYSIYMSNYEKQLIEEERKRREEKESQSGGSEAIAREVYYNDTSSGEVKGYEMFTIVDSKTYTLDAYEYTMPAGGNAYSSKIFHMQGNYTREGNIATVEAGISMYAYTTTSASTQAFFPGETVEERKSIYESFVGGEKYALALKSDGTFEAGGTSDSEEAVTGVDGVKVYRWYDDSSRITIKTLTVFEDNDYIITAFSTHSTNHEQPVSSFIAHGKLSYDEDKGTEEYKIVHISDGIGMCYVSNNGSPMWNDCIADALHANWWDLSVGSRSFYVTDKGFTYVNGMIKEEIPAWGLYGYTETSEPDPGPGPEKPEIITTLQGDKNPAIQLTLYKDGTADFTFTTYNSTTSGTWSYAHGVFTFKGTANKQDGTTVDFVNESKVNADGSIVIAIDTKNGMTQNFTLTAEQFSEILGEKFIFLEGNSANGSLITLTLYEDKTFLFHFGAHGQNTDEAGTFTYENGELVLTTAGGYEAVKAPLSGETATFTYNAFGGQANQEYTISVAALEALIGAPEELFTAVGKTNNTINLTFYSDGTAVFVFPQYNVSETANWTYENGMLVLKVGEKETGRGTLENGEISFTYSYSASSALNQPYTITAEQLAKLG